MSITAALAASWAMLRARSVVLLGLGAAVVLSLLSVCCGLGLLTTPWFMCELFAVQLALCADRPVVRGVAFIPAGLILLGAVLMVSAVAWIALLGAGSAASGQMPQVLSLSALMRSGGAAAFISATLALLLVVPLLYAPLILIEQHTRFDQALAESVRLVVVSGVFASLRLSLCAHLVQASPLLLAALLASFIDHAEVAWFTLLATPLLVASVPLGQGMIVWNYTRVRERLDLSPEREGTRAVLGSNRAWVRAWALLILSPICALLLLELSLLRPSRVPRGTLSAEPAELIAELTPHDDHPLRVVLPDTALEVAAGAHEVSVAASDGGGAGSLPLRAAEPIERVRVARVRDAFALELTQGGRHYLTWIDRAGVRLDDDLRARLLDRTSPAELWLFLCSLLATGIASVPVLHALGRVQRGYRLPAGRRPSYDALALDQSRSLRRARLAAALLVPLSLLCLTLAVLALTAA